MGNDLAERLSQAEGLSIRAVLVPEGVDATAILSQHGMMDMVAIPFVSDDATLGGGKAMGDGVQSGVRATLVMDQDANPQGDKASEAPNAGQPGWQQPDHDASSSGTGTLPRAYGMKPMAPVRKIRE